MSNDNSIQPIDCCIDFSHICDKFHQLSHEIHDSLQISNEDAEKVDHFEFDVRFIPEFFVNVYPRR